MRGRVKAVVFDLYGTLIYIRNDRKAFKRMLGDLGGNTKQGADRAWRIAFTRYFSDIPKLAKAINPDNRIDIPSYEKEIFDEIGRAGLFSDTLETLSHLRRKKIALGLISDVTIPYHRPFFDLGLRKMFDEYIFSCEAGLIKPDPEIYRMMLEKLGVEPGAALMVGDNPICDVNGPKSVEMKAVLLERDGSKNTQGAVRSLEGIYRLV